MKYDNTLKNRASGGLASSFFDSMIIRRIIAFTIDQFICTVAGILVIGFLSSFNGINTTVLTTAVIVAFSIFGLLCRDLLRPGIGKRIMRLSIRPAESSDIVPLWKLIVRNITLGIWPIELIVLDKTNGTQRLADKWLNIKVVKR